MLNRIFRQTDIPREYRSNFLHLYFDIGWFGILSGSAVNFLNVYAARLGASGLQIGLIAASAAVVNLLISIPAGRWVEKRDTNRAVFRSSVLFRIGYALWIPLPWLFDAQGQIWTLVALAFLMAIPLTPLSVGFNALFAEAVPNQYRARVAGVRNVVLSIAFVASSLISGYILDNLDFPVGYQIVFVIGFIGAAMSSLHLYFVRPLAAARDLAPAPPQSTESPRSIFSSLRLDIARGPFGKVLLVMFGFHFAHYICNPIYPLYSVNELHLNDNNLGVGAALYYLTVLIGSIQLSRAVHRLGHKRVTGWGMAAMSLYPFLLALAGNVWQYYTVSLVGGFTWAMAGGAYANYMLERAPSNDLPSHLAWYSMALNAATLIGSFAGPAIAQYTGLAGALMVFALIRFLAGLAVLKWG